MAPALDVLFGSLGLPGLRVLGWVGITKHLDASLEFPMDDQALANPDKKELDASPPTPEVAQAGNPNPANPPNAQRFADVEREMTGFERSTLRWARTAVILSGVAALFVCLQWREMHEGSIDTHNLATAAANQATWTERLKGSTDTESGYMQQLAGHMSDQADRTKDLAVEAKVQATAAQASANAVVSANRSWIVPDFPPQHKPSIEAANLEWHNAGKTPAIAVSSWKEYFLGTMPQHLRSCGDIERDVKRQPSDSRQYQAFVAEGGKYEVGLDHAPAWRGQQPIDIHGCIWYTDVSSNTEKSSEFFYTAIQNKLAFPSSEGISVFFDGHFIYK